MTLYLKLPRMQISHKFISKVFIPAFKTLHYNLNISFHPQLLLVPKIPHSSVSLFSICTFVHAVLSVRNALATLPTNSQSFKDHPNYYTLYIVFLSNFKVYFSLFWNLTALLVLSWHLSQSVSQENCVYYLPSLPPNRWNCKLLIERTESHSCQYALLH